MIGRVVSTKMQNTAAVLISRRKKHPLYKKTFLRTKKYLVDDPIGVKNGDIVRIEKVRPISKRKHWQIKKVLGKDFVALGKESLKEGAKVAIAEVLPEDERETAMQQSSNTAEKEIEKKEAKTGIRNEEKKTRKRVDKKGEKAA